MDREKRPEGITLPRFLNTPRAWAFFGAVLFGLAAHGMGLTNKFSWHDDIFSLFLTGATITSGRWMLHVLSELEIFIFGDGHYSLPLVNGLLSLMCIGASAGLIAGLMKIRSRGLSALLGGMMAAFPMITSLFSFMFTAHYYALALLMMTGAACLILGETPFGKKALGILLGACSVGIYQAFLPLLPALALLRGIADLAEKKEKTSAFLTRFLWQMLCAAGVLAVYMAASRLFLAAYHLEMDSYMGLNQVEAVSLETYARRAALAYREFFLPQRNVLTDMYPQHAYYMYLLMLALDGALGLGMVIRTWKKSRSGAVLQILLLALFPLGCNLIFLMSEEVHSLMVYGQTAQAVLLVYLTDRTEVKIQKLGRAVPGVTAAVLLMTNIMYVRYANQCYLKTEFQQQEAISWNTALVARIKSAKGYRDELPVAWVRRKEMEDQSLYNMNELNFTQLAGYHQDEQLYLNNVNWDNFMERWCGFAPEVVSSEFVEDWPEVREMPCYPDEGSIQVIRDTVIVKFGL